MVERVSITPQIMTLRDAGGNPTFSTDFRYIKNVSPGTLSLTQENKIPVPYKSSITPSQDGGHTTFDPGYLQYGLTTGADRALLRIGVAPAKGTFVIAPQALYRFGIASAQSNVAIRRYSNSNLNSQTRDVMLAWPGTIGYILVNGQFQDRYYPEYGATYWSALYGCLYDWYWVRVVAANQYQTITRGDIVGRVLQTSARGDSNNMDPSTTTTLYIPVEAGDVVQLQYTYNYDYNYSTGQYDTYAGQGLRMYWQGVSGVPEGYYDGFAMSDGATLFLGGVSNTYYQLRSRFYSDTETLPLGVTA